MLGRMSKFAPFKTLVALIAGGLMATPAVAEDYSSVVSARFLPGWESAHGTVMAGLEIRLEPGWKTYWRAPGDAGIPPQFDWSRSSNLSAVQVIWPTPKVTWQNGMRSIGYTEHVILPIELTPHTPGQAISLHTSLLIGVCQDICMPVTISVSSPLTGQSESPAIRAALDNRAMPAGKAGVRNVQCRVEPIADGLRVTASMTAPKFGADEVVVIEAPDPSIWVSEAAVTRTGNTISATAEMVPNNAAPFSLDRSEVRITLLGDGTAIDIRGCKG